MGNKVSDRSFGMSRSWKTAGDEQLFTCGFHVPRNDRYWRLHEADCSATNGLLPDFVLRFFAQVLFQGIFQDRHSLRDSPLSRVGVVETIDHDEVVDDAQITCGCNGDPGGPQFSGVGLSFIA